MRFGLYVPNFGPFGDAGALADLARDAERAGWDGFFIWDHVARAWPTPVADPWVALAAVATVTERVRIGALVTPLPRRRPWKVARETVSLDRLSGGRLVFGAGIGSPGGADAERGCFGEEEDATARGVMLDEGLEVLSGLWSGGTFRFDGVHYRVGETTFLPKPIQTPRIPVWIAGTWPHRAPFRRAARWDGVFPLYAEPRGGTCDDVRAVVRFIRDERAEAGLFEVVHLATPSWKDARSRVDAVRRYADAGVSWWLERMTPDSFGADWRGAWPLERLRSHVVGGPPAVDP